MKKKQIIAAIILVTGETVDSVARKNGYTKSIFYRVINGTVKKTPIRKIISELINKPIDHIWPT